MNPSTIATGTREYKNMTAVANMLEALSPNGASYVVKDVYFDIGLNWMWTTICRMNYRDCQVLCPRDWEKIVTAETSQDLENVVESIRGDRFFGDK